MITQTRLKELVVYDPESGLLTALFDGDSRGGKFRIRKGEIITGCLTGKYYKEGRGYVTVYIDKRQYKLHRLAWLYMTGNWPEYQIDHINGITTDNRWCNLRQANNSQNTCNQKIQRNNTSGYKGVSWDNNHGLWRARIMINMKTIGKYFKTIEDAVEWRKSVLPNLHGEYANNG